MDKEKKKMMKILGSLTTVELPKKRENKESKIDSNWKKNPEYRTPDYSNNKESYVAIDCEMVSTEDDKNALARVSVVNMNGEVLIDMYSKPESKVINYRTSITGIRPKHLNSAKKFGEVKKNVENILSGKIVVGHSIHNDLNALKIEIPPDKVRDTQALYSQMHGVSGISLQKLCFQTLGKMIQTGHHSSVEDALATIEIYKTLFLSNKSLKKRKKTRNSYKTHNEKAQPENKPSQFS